MKLKTASCLIIILALTGCGKDEQPAAEGEEAATAPPLEHEQIPPLAQQDAQEVSSECGQGGTECPAGLECLTWRNGEQACGPKSGPGTVLIKDATLGGGCLSPNPADPLPGASIASVQVIGVDGNVKGHGRMLWDEPGFEVAAERGTPPDGTEFRGDACTDYYNLGCDGQAVFEISGTGGDVQKLREGEMVIVHLRGQDSCGEEVADEVEGAICNDPEAAASGDLSSCTFKVRMVEARSDMYGPDRMGGTINFFEPR